MDPYRRKFEIGLYHGDESGHVLMHVNGEPIIIDFSIKEDKEYSFYLGPELFNLIFKKAINSFEYKLEKDLEAPTRLNEARKENDRQDYLLMILGAGVVVVIVLGVLLL